MRLSASLAVAVMAALVQLRLLSQTTTPPAFDFHGCMLAGVGRFSHGGSQTRWNYDKVGRLGNEEDTCDELALGSRVFKKDGTGFFVSTRLP